MRCLFWVLKRGALSHMFVWKLNIAVNFFTPVVETLTASESVKPSFQKKRNGSASSDGSQRFWMETNAFVKADLWGCSSPAGLFENEQGHSPRKTCPGLFRFVVK
jgi:hypothetical protein